MQFTAVTQFTKRSDADIAILPFWESTPALLASQATTVNEYIKMPLQLGDFGGKEGELVLIYVPDIKEQRLLLLGLGKEARVTVDSLRKAFANAARLCSKKKIARINLVLPESKGTALTEQEIWRGIGEGLLLSNYRWDQLKGNSSENSQTLIEEVNFIGASQKILTPLKKMQNIAEGVYFARDLINGNADDVTPKFLADTAVEIGKKFNITTTILNKKEIEEARMGLLFAVGRGSPHEPAFIIMKYEGNPRSKEHTVLIGKGVTFDTGGLNLKPTGSMETMRDDMSGAAAVMGAITTIAALGLKVNATAVVAAAENAIDGRSFKPGDVYKSYSGKTVEIGNTDAEGRLTLADAISYSIDHLAPTRIINLATLTGAMVIALGEEISGFMSNNDELSNQLLEASQATSELLWRLPLHAPYKESLKSDIADLKNVGGRPAGSIVAGLFLQEFVGNIPWAHIDIAGTAFGSKERSYLPKNGVGFGVRLLVELLENSG